MMTNPYEPPRILVDQPPGGLLASVRKLRTAVAILVFVVIFQWICHLVTAVAMVSWMNKADVGPTSQAIDTFFSGLLCVGFTALLSAVGAVAGVSAVRRSKLSFEETRIDD